MAKKFHSEKTENAAAFAAFKRDTELSQKDALDVRDVSREIEEEFRALEDFESEF